MVLGLQRQWVALTIGDKENVLTFAARFKLAIGRLISSGFKADDETIAGNFSVACRLRIPELCRLLDDKSSPKLSLDEMIKLTHSHEMSNKEAEARTAEAAAMNLAETSKRLNSLSSSLAEKLKRPITCYKYGKPNHVALECR